MDDDQAPSQSVDIIRRRRRRLGLKRAARTTSEQYLGARRTVVAWT
jgi:hypothetical protein